MSCINVKKQILMTIWICFNIKILLQIYVYLKVDNQMNFYDSNDMLKINIKVFNNQYTLLKIFKKQL